MPSTVLLTLGRLPVALEIARAFHAAGFRVVVAEPFAWPVCRVSRCVDKCYRTTAPVVDANTYYTELLDIIDAEQISIVIPVSEEILFVSALNEKLPSSVKLVCMDTNSLLTLHDKYLFNRWAKAHDLPVPLTVLAREVPDASSLLAAEYVVKPRLSCSGTGVRFGKPREQLSPTERSEQYIVQQRLTGHSLSTFSIAVDGQVLVTIAYRGLLTSGSVSVCFEEVSLPEELKRFVTQAATVLEYNGMISFDFIQDEHGHWQAIECNPRATSGIHFVNSDHIVQPLLAVAGAVSSQSVQTPANPGDRRQEFWSCLARVEGDLFKLKWNGQGWRQLFTTRDITWSWRDAKPFLLLPVVLAPHLGQAIKRRQAVAELLMLDVGWYQS